MRESESLLPDKKIYKSEMRERESLPPVQIMRKSEYMYM